MHLAANAEQQAIKDAVRRFCEEQISVDRLRVWEQEARAEAAGLGSQHAALWQAVAALGWFSLALPVAAGGSGLGLVEVGCLLEECARGLLPRRLINAVRAAYALTRLNPQLPMLAALGRGEQMATLAFDEQSGRDPRTYTAWLDADGGREWVSGRKLYLADATAADWHLVAARDGSAGIALVLVAGSGVETKVVRALDGEQQAHVTYARAPVVARLSPPGAGAALLDQLRQEQAALALAEMLGAMDAALAMTVAYVKEREQFGQKIAVFQAVQHQIADMATATTASRHLTWQAITRLAAGNLEGFDLAAACAFVGQAAKRVTLTAHHLHGGAGYVVEHPLHYHSERAQALCIRYAAEGQALATVAATLLD